MKAVILAAGRGKRLLPFTKLIPKPLMPIEIDEKNRFITIIEKLILQLVKAKIKEIIIVLNYKSKMIQDYLGDGVNYNCELTYVSQKKLDGNAGAFFEATTLLNNDDALILDSDQYLRDLNLVSGMITKFEEDKLDILVGVANVENVCKYAIIKIENGKPIDIYEKPISEMTFGNLAKSGIMIISNRLAKMGKSIAMTKEGDYTTTQIIKYAIQNELKIELHNISFSDIGTWDEYIKIIKFTL